MEGTDTLPMWHGGKVYYLSDQGSGSRLNIWSYDVVDGSREQVTHLADYDVKWPSIGLFAFDFRLGSTKPSCKAS